MVTISTFLNDGTERVRMAFRNTPVDYLSMLAKYHSSKSTKGMGATYAIPPDYILDAVQNMLEWTTYHHGSVLYPLSAFVANGFGGKVNVLNIDSVPEKDGLIILKKNPKRDEVHGMLAVSSLMGHMFKPYVDHTVCILKRCDSGIEVVADFHPGDPRRPTVLPAMDYEGAVVSKSIAKQIGLEWIQVPG